MTMNGIGWLMRICDLEATGFKFECLNMWVICEQDLRDGSFGFSFYSPLYSEYNLEAMIEKEVGIAFRFYHNFEEHLKVIQESPFCFHNYFQSDKPTIKKFYPNFQPKEEHDSYILSQLLNPDRGLHGLDAWAKRLRGEQEGKVVHEEWDRFSPAMLKRVIDDVRVNVLVWEALQKEKKEWEDQGGSWDEAIKIEYGIADLQGRQEMHGVKLDIDKAYDLADEIYVEIQKIDEQLREQLPMRVIQGTEVLEPYRKDGQIKQVVARWFE